MFAEKGFTPIVEIYPWFLDSVSFWTDAPAGQSCLWADFEERAGNEVWKCLSEASELFASTLAHGMVKISVATVTNAGERYGFRNTHIDVRVGTLGSGSGILGESDRALNATASENFSRVHYGPLAFHPLALRSAFWKKYTERFEASIRAEFGYASLRSDSKRNYVEEIIELLDAGKENKKWEMKARLAPDMKTDEWKLHWTKAAVQRPELSKSGPKPKLNKFEK